MPVREQHTSGLTSRLVLSYVEKEGGRATVEALLRRCGLVDEEERLRDPTFWFDFRTKVGLLEAAGELLAHPDTPRRIGQAAVELQALSGLKVALRAFGSPRLAYGALPGVSPRFTRAHRMELVALDDDFARFRYCDAANVGYHAVDCQYTAGLLSCITTLFGGLPAQISHPTCALRGGSECVYELRWEAHPSGRKWILAGLGTGTVAALLSRSPAGRRILPIPVAAGLGATHRAIRGQRQRRRSLEAEIKAQEEAADRLSAFLRDLVSDLRTDEILRKIMDNAQTALLGREVAVIVGSGGPVRAYGSARIPESSLRVLERWAMDPESLGHPLTVPELTTVPELADLAAHPETPLGAMSVAPLVFRGDRLGALVALTRRSDAFLPKEIALLELYAAEAAIALGNARLVERLEALARHDSLTGLLNHAEFQETLAGELERAQREGTTLSVAMLDLDGFKEVNDEYGHAEGDRVLRMVAAKIRSVCRGADRAARIGGDEFALILPGRAAAEAEALVTDLQREIASFGIGTGISSGVAEWPTAGPSQSLLLFNADRALYDAKVSGSAGEGRPDAAGARQSAPASAVDPGVAAIQHRRGLTAALARAVDAKDSYTRSHCETVAELCAAIGQELELEHRHVLKLRLAGLLHDVGKIGIADAILQKPAALTPEEYEVMKTHAPLGHSILYAAELFEEARWVLHHHERLDGQGYPDGLRSESIPLESRIILVSDAFEAMTSDRPYRCGRPEGEAVAELERRAGVQFDADCVDALKRVLRRGPQWASEPVSDGTLFAS